MQQFIMNSSKKKFICNCENTVDVDFSDTCMNSDKHKICIKLPTNSLYRHNGPTTSIYIILMYII